jgi:glutamate racemase
VPENALAPAPVEVFVPRLGIFDSGVGGLTVEKAILERLPGLETLYLGDTARVPYGTKSPEVVTQYSLRNARFLVARGIDLLVVACNTASAVALPALREALEIPVLGVVEPGARAAAHASRTGRIGVVGTASTIASGAYQRALRALRPDALVLARACPLFVPLAEEGWTDPADEVVEAVARRYLAPMVEAGIDTLVLGCTHYPLLRGAIARQLPGVELVDSAAAIAAEVAGRFPGGSGERPSHRFFVTDTPERFLTVAERFLGRRVERAEQVDI